MNNKLAVPLFLTMIMLFVVGAVATVFGAALFWDSHPDLHTMVPQAIETGREWANKQAESLAPAKPASDEEPAIVSPVEPEPLFEDSTSQADLTVASGEWEIIYYVGATDQMHQWGADLKNLAPDLWKVFPNEPNVLVPEFTTADGLEYAEDETGYCEQQELCDIVVPPLHYRIVTGDYSLPFDSCVSSGDTGCGFMMINVGDVSTGLEDVSVDFGFTVWGRYFNGDAMPIAIWSGLSKTANNMLHLESELNPHPLPNAGGNCSVPTGCPKARLAFYIMSGNELLVQGVTIVSQ